MREIEGAPKTPAEAALLRAASDKAWASFVLTPAWAALRLEFEGFRHHAAMNGIAPRQSCCDRAILCAQAWFYETFLSAPDKALQRLRMQAAASDATETSTGEPSP